MDYTVKGYRSHEDEQYDRSENLFENGSLQACILFARNHIVGARDYQVNVCNSSTKKLVYSNRSRVEYRFVSNDASTFKELSKLTGKLIDCLISDRVITSSDFRLSLFEENGSVNILNSLTGKVLIRDIFDNNYCSQSVKYCVEKLIMLFNSIFDRGVKRYTFVVGREVGYYYFTDSKEEKGSLDVYLDYF